MAATRVGLAEVAALEGVATAPVGLEPEEAVVTVLARQMTTRSTPRKWGFA